jgi:polyhydroxyalkanoate synthesis regulator protein
MRWRPSRRNRNTRIIIVRRYARSRLYDTVAGRYLTVDDLRQWLGDGVAFQVRDSETGEDITRVLLA